MEIGSETAGLVQQSASNQAAQAAPEVSVKERFDKQMSSAKVAEQSQPSLREVMAERAESSSKVVDILKEVSEINAHINIMQSSLQLSVDQASGRSVVTVMDKGTGEFIRQIPSQEVLKMSARIRQYMESMQQQMLQSGGKADLQGLLYEGKG